MKTEPSNHKSLFQDLKMANVYLRINFLNILFIHQAPSYSIYLIVILLQGSVLFFIYIYIIILLP